MDSGRKINYSESKNGREYKEDKYLSNHNNNNSQLLKKYIHDIRNSNKHI